MASNFFYRLRLIFTAWKYLDLNLNLNLSFPPQLYRFSFSQLLQQWPFNQDLWSVSLKSFTGSAFLNRLSYGPGHGCHPPIYAYGQRSFLTLFNWFLKKCLEWSNSSRNAKKNFSPLWPPPLLPHPPPFFPSRSLSEWVHQGEKNGFYQKWSSGCQKLK